MGWVSKKVYAILSSDEEGKKILEGIGEKDQDTVDKEVDGFFDKTGQSNPDKGKQSASPKKTKSDDEEEIPDLDKDTFDEFKRFDFGLGLRIGAEIKQKYSLSLGYDFGLLNCWNSNYWGDEDEDIDLVNTVKNRNFYISLGYKF